MWICDVWREKPKLSIFIILFFIIQIANNLRQDIAISPFYSYGMYSSVAHTDSPVNAVFIMVDNQQLNPLDFQPQVWDKITYPLVCFSKAKIWNKHLFETDINRLIPFVESERFTKMISEKEFQLWYKNYLEKIVDRRIETLDASIYKYQFENGKWRVLQLIYSISDK
jgi:hypothetical protein